MPNFTGRFEICTADGTPQQGGACSIAFDEETLRLAADTTPGFAIDLGDVDAVDPGDYQLSLKIYDHTVIRLSQFGKAQKNLQHDLVEAWHNRLVKCLLLEDLDEVARAVGFVQLDSAERTFSSDAEIRLYKSNIAVLSTKSPAFHWRLADIDTAKFDENQYAIELQSGPDRLILGKLAKRSREFWGQLAEQAKLVSDRSAQILHSLLPFLSPGQTIEVMKQLKEGRMVAIPALDSIDPSIGKALCQNAVEAQSRPYFDALMHRSAAPGPFFGFKLMRKAEDAEEEMDSGPNPAAKEGVEARDAYTGSGPAKPILELGEEILFFWFAFPLNSSPESPAGAAAWECTSQSGRATYVFRLSQAEQSQNISSSVQRLNRGMVLVNFHREPIYLPDDALKLNPRYRRYAIAQRNLPLLRDLRSQFLGRAIHSSLDAWQAQLDSILGKMR